jgi:hypothetical protein
VPLGRLLESFVPNIDRLLIGIFQGLSVFRVTHGQFANKFSTGYGLATFIAQV